MAGCYSERWGTGGSRRPAASRGGYTALRVRIMALVVVLVTVFAVFAYQRSLSEVAKLGAPAPAFDLPDTGGNLVSLGALRGRVVLLDFWASWCTVCREDAPALRTFAARYGDRVAVLGVDWREPEAAVTQAVAAWGLDFQNLRDADGSVARRYGLSGVPEDWWIGPDGRARLHTVGAVTFEQLQLDYEHAVGAPIDGSGIVPVAGGRATALAVVGDRIWLGVAGGDTPGLWSALEVGGSWTRAPLSGDVGSIAGVGNDILVYGPTMGVMESTDGGAEWGPVSRTASGPAFLAVSTTIPPVWHAWAGGHLWEVTDLAFGWKSVV